MPRPLLLVLLLLSAACSRGASRPPSRLADGGYSLACRGPLSDCLRQAERVCGDGSYTVTEAQHIRQMLGAPTGQSQVVVQRSEATVYCGDHKPEKERPPIELKRATPLPPPAAPAPAPAAGPVRACVPGSTQACVGPAGCSGGQVCAADASHYEACDCGQTAAPAPAATTAP
jgi:hypothetical protein